jgi:phage tail protein X
MNTSGKSIAHITESNERWDLLAWRYYGDASRYSAIIMANPVVAIEAVFEAGLHVDIPVLIPAGNDSAELPPWRRAQPVNG